VVQIAPEELRDRLGIIEPCAVAGNGQELRQCLRLLLDAERRREFTEKQNLRLHEYLSHFPCGVDAVCHAIEEELSRRPDVVEAKA